MPGSLDEGKIEALEMLRWHEVAPRTILDIGPGQGTWWKALGVRIPNAFWTAIEIWPPYVEAYDLEIIYDRVIIDDALTVPLSALNTFYDLAIFGDVVEHKPKAEGIEMVDRLPWVHALVSMPIKGNNEQGEYMGNPWEAHLHQWDEDQVMNAFPVVDKWIGDILGVFLLERPDLHQLQRSSQRSAEVDLVA